MSLSTQQGPGGRLLRNLPMRCPPMLADIAILYFASLPRNRLRSLQMIRTDVVASSHQNDGCQDGRHVDPLDDAQQNLLTKYAIAQK